MKLYYKQYNSFGKIVLLLTYNQAPNIKNPLIVEITAEEYAALSAEFEEKAALAEKLYTGKIAIDDVPEAWREEIQARVDDIIASQGAYEAQDISDTEALNIITGGDANEAN